MKWKTLIDNFPVSTGWGDTRFVLAYVDLVASEVDIETFCIHDVFGAHTIARFLRRPRKPSMADEIERMLGASISHSTLQQ